VDIWHLGDSIEGVDVEEPNSDISSHDGGVRCRWYMEVQEGIDVYIRYFCWERWWW
jgi:hypothetical protein